MELRSPDTKDVDKIRQEKKGADGGQGTVPMRAADNNIGDIHEVSSKSVLMGILLLKSWPLKVPKEQSD